MFPGYSTGNNYNQILEKLARKKIKIYLLDLAIRKLLLQQEHLNRERHKRDCARLKRKKKI